ncbi:transposase [Pseudoxanthomonas sp. PXM02]|uniref:transposase n=1 Tax=Pseudoxanthomonas sp. PXM02 TaxID=2769294 RepID=UPI001785576E|nr:transposase [Pseudoxanthomonas sp. PXM02]MBD9478818.1 transposase [Pseudoxanthomonas sp. PXM02]
MGSDAALRSEEEAAGARVELPATTAPSATAATPHGIGPRALSQWPIMQRLTPEEWKQLMQALPGRVGARARHGGNARRFIEAVLWVAQTGAYWSDLPPEFGSWHGIYVRFIRWAQDGNWAQVLAHFDPQDPRALDLNALIQRYLLRNNTKYLSRAMRAS